MRRAQGNAVILDDDPEVSFGNDAFRFNENAGNATITLTRNGAPSLPTRITRESPQVATCAVRVAAPPSNRVTTTTPAMVLTAQLVPTLVIFRMM